MFTSDVQRNRKQQGKNHMHTRYNPFYLSPGAARTSKVVPLRFATERRGRRSPTTRRGGLAAASSPGAGAARAPRAGRPRTGRLRAARRGRVTGRQFEKQCDLIGPRNSFQNEFRATKLHHSFRGQGSLASFPPTPRSSFPFSFPLCHTVLYWSKARRL
jgi:hypothetical protein